MDQVKLDIGGAGAKPLAVFSCSAAARSVWHAQSRTPFSSTVGSGALVALYNRPQLLRSCARLVDGGVSARSRSGASYARLYSLLRRIAVALI